MKLSRNAAILLGLVLLLSGVYYLYAALTQPPLPEVHGFWSEVGEGFGAVAGWGLGFLYCRGVLKVLLRESPWPQRLLPEDYAEQAKGVGQIVLRFLDRTHPWLGVATILLLGGHALASGQGRLNLFLALTLAVAFWQGGFGLFLKSRWAPVQLRKHSYAVHAQLVTAGLILIFAGFGHLLVGD